MTTTAGDQPIPAIFIYPLVWCSQVCRRLAAERDEARQQFERISVMGRQLVAEVKELRAEREIALKQLAEIGALSLFSLNFEN